MISLRGIDCCNIIFFDVEIFILTRWFAKKIAIELYKLNFAPSHLDFDGIEKELTKSSLGFFDHLTEIEFLKKIRIFCPHYFFT